MGEPVGDTDVATSVEASLLRGFPETATGKVGKIETREAPVEILGLQDVRGTKHAGYGAWCRARAHCGLTRWAGRAPNNCRMQVATRNKASVVPVVALMTGVVAASLAVASTLHLSGSVSGRAKPFNPDAAGIAEAIIGVVLALAAVALWRSRDRARALGLSALGFAIAGFCLGLSITSRGGHWPDIAYHASVLPVLTVGFVALLRAPDASATTKTTGAPLTR